MNKEWWDSVIEACKVLRDEKPIQISLPEDPKKWRDSKFMQDGNRLIFLNSYWYRAKPEPKMRPLTPQEWLEAMIAGKRVTEIKTNRKQKLYFRLDFGRNETLTILICTGQNNLNFWTPNEMLERFRFSDGSPCGVEVEE